LREKIHTLLNIIGLAIGLACGVIIFLYIHHELTYDVHHEKGDRIYRVCQSYLTSDNPRKFAISSPQLGPRLFEEYPQIEAFVRIDHLGSLLFKHGQNLFTENNLAFADSNIVQVFTHTFIHGNPETCLKEPFTIVITERLARKYFGNRDPLGESILIENQLPVKVTGVIEDPPSNTQLPISGYLSYITYDRVASLPSIEWSMFEIKDFTYLLFRDTFDRKAFDKKWPEFYEKYMEQDAEIYGQVYEPIFHRLRDIHYHSKLDGDLSSGNITFIYTLLIIGILILVLAGINYTNLTTAKSLQRAGEIGLRKVVGASKGSLIVKIITESMLFTIISMIVALGIVEFVLEFTGFSQVLETSMHLNFFQEPIVLIGCVVLTLIVGLLSSLYPAFYLSSFNAVLVIHGLFKLKPLGTITRKFLVGFQIMLAISVVLFTLLLNTQIKYLENYHLGFDKDNVLIVPVQDSIMVASIPTVMNGLESFPEVKSVTSGGSWPGKPWGGLYKFEGNDGMEEHNIPAFFIGYNYLETLDFELIEGRDFNPDFPADSLGSVIINETLARYMNWDKPLGKRIQQFDFFDAVVVGVVKDFNFKSLHSEIQPLLLRLQYNYGDLIVRLDGTNPQRVMAYLEKTFQELVPYRPFKYYFLDERFDRQYNKDKRQIKLIQIFSVISIIISCLGLFGLASYFSTKRTNEIGIRKVQGAKMSQIIYLLQKEILIITLLAMIPSIPLTIWVFNVWLRDFAYQVGMNHLLILIVIMASVVLSSVTVLYHSINAARTNPVDSLRYE
jgi:putative ABC transport system permease protein